MSWVKGCLLILVSAVSAFESPVEGQETKQQIPSDTLKTRTSEIKRLICQLGGEKFHDREAAGKALEAIGPEALVALQKAASNNDDEEIRRRAILLVDSLEQQLYHESRCFKGHTKAVCGVAFSRDGKHV